MARYYTLAKAAKITQYSSGYPWPYEIAVCFEHVARPVGISEGVGHGAAAAHFTAAEALEKRWAGHFASAEGEWLLPIIYRMANGETVDVDEALSMYRAKHAKEPESYESKQF